MHEPPVPARSAPDDVAGNDMIVVRAPDVLHRSVAGVTVVAHETGADPPLRLGPLATLIWACLEFGATCAEITSDILAEFPEATIESLISGEAGPAEIDEPTDASGDRALYSRCVGAVGRTVAMLLEHGLVVHASSQPMTPSSIVR